MDCLLHLGLGNCISGIHVPSYPTQGMDSDYIDVLLDGTGHINAVMDWGKYIYVLWWCMMDWGKYYAWKLLMSYWGYNLNQK